MKLASILLALAWGISVSASAATIPPRLEARAAELRQQASPRILVWVRQRGAAVARTKTPVNLGALRQIIRSHIVAKGGPTANWGDEREQDIEAIVFLVLMSAVEDSDGDLKAIMNQLKSMNEVKANLRRAEFALNAVNEQPPARYEACQSNRDCSGGHKCIRGACR